MPFWQSLSESELHSWKSHNHRNTSTERDWVRLINSLSIHVLNPVPLFLSHIHTLLCNQDFSKGWFYLVTQAENEIRLLLTWDAKTESVLFCDWLKLCPIGTWLIHSLSRIHTWAPGRAAADTGTIHHLWGRKRKIKDDITLAASIVLICTEEAQAFAHNPPLPPSSQSESSATASPPWCVLTSAFLMSWSWRNQHSDPGS